MEEKKKQPDVKKSGEKDQFAPLPTKKLTGLNWLETIKKLRIPKDTKIFLSFPSLALSITDLMRGEFPGRTQIVIRKAKGLKVNYFSTTVPEEWHHISLIPCDDAVGIQSQIQSMPRARKFFADSALIIQALLYMFFHNDFAKLAGLNNLPIITGDKPRKKAVTIVILHYNKNLDRLNIEIESANVKGKRGICFYLNEKYY